MGTTKYIGLGVPVIVSSFTEVQMWYDFLLKLLLTTFTIGVGFKGGEVTPLFFVGATLGSALSALLPLPVSFLAGLGFVAVFAGATNTPIACTLMGIELFGIEAGIYLGIACVAAYLFPVIPVSILRRWWEVPSIWLTGKPGKGQLWSENRKCVSPFHSFSLLLQGL